MKYQTMKYQTSSAKFNAAKVEEHAKQLGNKHIPPPAPPESPDNPVVNNDKWTNTQMVLVGIVGVGIIYFLVMK